MGSKLALVSLSDRLVDRLGASHVADVVSPEVVYMSGARLEAGLRQAYADSLAGIGRNRAADLHLALNIATMTDVSSHHAHASRRTQS